MRVDVLAFKEFVADIHRQAAQEHDVFVWPHKKSGTGRLMLPIRCDGLRTTSPVLFVPEIRYDDNVDFHLFAPLEDPEVIGEIAGAWNANEARRFPVSGVEVNLVKTGPPTAVRRAPGPRADDLGDPRWW